MAAFESGDVEAMDPRLLLVAAAACAVRGRSQIASGAPGAHEDLRSADAYFEAGITALPELHELDVLRLRIDQAKCRATAGDWRRGCQLLEEFVLRPDLRDRVWHAMAEVVLEAFPEQPDSTRHMDAAASSVWRTFMQRAFVPGASGIMEVIVGGAALVDQALARRMLAQEIAVRRQQLSTRLESGGEVPLELVRKVHRSHMLASRLPAGVVDVEAEQQYLADWYRMLNELPLPTAEGKAYLEISQECAGISYFRGGELDIEVIEELAAQGSPLACLDLALARPLQTTSMIDDIDDLQEPPTTEVLLAMWRSFEDAFVVMQPGRAATMPDGVPTQFTTAFDELFLETLMGMVAAEPHHRYQVAIIEQVDEFCRRLGVEPPDANIASYLAYTGMIRSAQAGGTTPKVCLTDDELDRCLRTRGRVRVNARVNIDALLADALGEREDDGRLAETLDLMERATDEHGVPQYGWMAEVACRLAEHPDGHDVSMKQRAADFAVRAVVLGRGGIGDGGEPGLLARVHDVCGDEVDIPSLALEALAALGDDRAVADRDFVHVDASDVATLVIASRMAFGSERGTALDSGAMWERAHRAVRALEERDPGRGQAEAYESELGRLGADARCAQFRGEIDGATASEIEASGAGRRGDGGPVLALMNGNFDAALMGLTSTSFDDDVEPTFDVASSSVRAALVMGMMMGRAGAVPPAPLRTLHGFDVADLAVGPPSQRTIRRRVRREQRQPSPEGGAVPRVRGDDGASLPHARLQRWSGPGRGSLGGL
jgi:hypothetical protein